MPEIGSPKGFNGVKLGTVVRVQVLYCTQAARSNEDRDPSYSSRSLSTSEAVIATWRRNNVFVGVAVDGADVARLAARWRREFDEDADWHLRRKIEQLQEWGDPDGATVFEHVLEQILSERARSSSTAKPKLA